MENIWKALSRTVTVVMSSGSIIGGFILFIWHLDLLISVPGICTALCHSYLLPRNK